MDRALVANDFRTVRGDREFEWGRVAQGALMAAGADFYMVGRQMGDVAARMFRGEDPAKIPVIYALPKVYGFNLTALNGLKDAWQVPPELLAKADTVIDATGTHLKK